MPLAFSAQRERRRNCAGIWLRSIFTSEPLLPLHRPQWNEPDVLPGFPRIFAPGLLPGTVRPAVAGGPARRFARAVPPWRGDAAVLRTDAAGWRLDPAIWRTDAAIWRTDAAVLRTDAAIWRADASVWRLDPAIVRLDPPRWRTDPAVFRSAAAFFRADAAVWRLAAAVWRTDAALRSSRAAKGKIGVEACNLLWAMNPADTEKWSHVAP